jgi:NADH:ubiquinone oxidoreductase subunit 3 (subunit A)
MVSVTNMNLIELDLNFLFLFLIAVDKSFQREKNLKLYNFLKMVVIVGINNIY